MSTISANGIIFIPGIGFRGEEECHVKEPWQSRKYEPIRWSCTDIPYGSGKLKWSPDIPWVPYTYTPVPITPVAYTPPPITWPEIPWCCTTTYIPPHEPPPHEPPPIVPLPPTFFLLFTAVAGMIFLARKICEL